MSSQSLSSSHHRGLKRNKSYRPLSVSCYFYLAMSISTLILPPTYSKCVLSTSILSLILLESLVFLILLNLVTSTFLPSHKLGSLLSNYRPISHLSFLPNLTEWVVKHYLTHHLSSNSLLNSFQSAYTKHHSTQSTLISVRDHIIKAMSQQKSLLFVFLIYLLPLIPLIVPFLFKPYILLVQP